MKTELKAIRIPDFDNLKELRPFAVVLDLYDEENNFIQSGTEWSYFSTESQAKNYCKLFNKSNY